jgi:serine/threonine protein kinase
VKPFVGFPSRENIGRAMAKSTAPGYPPPGANNPLDREPRASADPVTPPPGARERPEEWNEIERTLVALAPEDRLDPDLPFDDGESGVVPADDRTSSKPDFLRLPPLPRRHSSVDENVDVALLAPPVPTRGSGSSGKSAPSDAQRLGSVSGKGLSAGVDTELDASTPTFTGGTPGEPVSAQSSVDLAEAVRADPHLSPAAQPDFVLRERLARGGQGEVWRALQPSLDREIAVKILGSESDAVGFLQEAYTSAELDHPNIAPVYEMGTSTIGGRERRFLAMKLVRGAPWHELLARDRSNGKLTRDGYLAKHLNVLVSVCNAVAYAHSKRIIHRDLKPRQVIVGDYGEVYLLDWGLALCLRRRAPNVGGADAMPKFRLRNGASNRAGTPAYMAPEQTISSSAELGFRTDIYLLGAILFEIVAGSPPHAAETASLAYKRACENWIHPLPDDCPPELRAIIQRSLDEEPGRRFGTVNKFRASLEDYLSGASRQRESREIVQRVSKRMEEAEKAPIQGYDHYVETERDLVRALSLWPGNWSAAKLRQRVALQCAKAALAGRDLKLARALAPHIASRKHREQLLADIRTAERRRKRETLERFALLGVSDRPRLRARPLRQRLSSATRRVARERLGRANDLLVRERDRSESARRQAEELVNFLVSDLHQGLRPLGRLDLLERAASKSKDYFLALAEEDDSPATRRKMAVALRNHGDVMVEQGHLDAALASFEAYIRLSLELGGAEAGANPALFDSQTLRDVADVRSRVARVHYQQRKRPEAMAEETRSMAMRQELVRRDPNDLLSRGDLASSLNGIGLNLWREGKFEEGIAKLNEALELRRGLVAADPNNERWQDDLAWTLGTIGTAWVDRGDLELGLKCHVEALGLRDALSRSDPANAERRDRVAWTLGSIGYVQELQDERDEALETMRRALAIRLELAETDPANGTLMSQIAWGRNRIGALLGAKGEWQAAYDEHDAALALAVSMAIDTPNNMGVKHTLCMTRLRVARALTALGREEEAKEHWEEALKLAEELAPDLSAPPDLAAARALVLAALGRVEEAKPWAEGIFARGWHGHEFMALWRELGLPVPGEEAPEGRNDDPADAPPAESAAGDDPPPSELEP